MGDSTLICPFDNDRGSIQADPAWRLPCPRSAVPEPAGLPGRLHPQQQECRTLAEQIRIPRGFRRQRTAGVPRRCASVRPHSFRLTAAFGHPDNRGLLAPSCRYAIVADYLYRTYPKLRVGYLSAIRQRIVQNTTLAKFARLYKMDQALELGPDSERLRNDAKSEPVAKSPRIVSKSLLIVPLHSQPMPILSRLLSEPLRKSMDKQPSLAGLRTSSSLVRRTTLSWSRSHSH
jgi:hypothetical protein